MSTALAQHDLNLPPPPAPPLKASAAPMQSPSEDMTVAEVAALSQTLDDTLAMDLQARQRATQDLEARALAPASYAPLLLRLVTGPGQPPARRSEVLNSWRVSRPKFSSCYLSMFASSSTLLRSHLLYPFMPLVSPPPSRSRI